MLVVALCAVYCPVRSCSSSNFQFFFKRKCELLRWYCKVYVEKLHGQITSLTAPVSHVMCENIRREPWKLGLSHEPIPWREEAVRNLKEGKVKAERRRTLKLSYLSDVLM